MVCQLFVNKDMNNVIFQHDENDCGAACLAMILQHFGSFVSVGELRDATDTNSEGVSLYGIIKGSQKYGLEAEALQGSVEELIDELCSGNEKNFPFIAHVKNEKNEGHFVVVEKYLKNRFVILDPEKGKYSLSEKDFDTFWLGSIVRFCTTDKFIQQEKKGKAFSRYFKLLKGQYHKFIIAFILSVVIAVFGILSAYIFQTVIDKFGYTTGYYHEHEHEHDHEEGIEEEDEEEKEEKVDAITRFIDSNAENYSELFVLAILLYSTQFIIQYIRRWLIIYVSRKIDVKLSDDCYSHIIHLPMRSINGRKTGDYMSRFTDITLIKEMIANVSITIVLDILMAIGCGILLFRESHKMFFVSVCILLSYAIVVFIFREPLRTINRKSMAKNAALEAYVKECFDNVETIKTNGSELRMDDLMNDQISNLTNLEMKESLLSGAQETISGWIEMVGTIVIMWIGFGIVLAHGITFGELVSFFVLLSYFMSPIKNLIQLQPDIQTAVIAAERLNDIFDMAIEEYDEKNVIPRGWNSIKCDNVAFAYGNNDNILENVSLEIPHGCKMAIVGENGSGKTTLSKLIVELIKPSCGHISIDGTNIEDFSLPHYRSKISYVSQNAYLFSDTIKNNLLLGLDATDDEIESVSRKCKIDEIVMQQPYGYNTVLLENGDNLSLGQKQRIAIARALLKKPDIIILDEATSNIDSKTENVIDEWLFNDKSLTVIIVTHKLERAKKCDKIIVMKNGTIVEQGDYNTLMSQQGVFYKMANEKQYM